MTSLREILSACVPYLPESYRSEFGGLLTREWLDRLADRLLTIHRDGLPTDGPRPHFSAECTPPLESAYAAFVDALNEWEADRAGPQTPRAFAEAMRAAGCANLLLLLGQRRTPATLTDSRGIPPSRAVLLRAAGQPCGPRDPLTVAARALAKHVHRSPEALWGKVVGSAADKNRAARVVLEGILDGATWWNVFGHYKHETVFEARVPSGHGARWGKAGTVFIGFLEPFDEERRGETTTD
jgi:hypothetical protein